MYYTHEPGEDFHRRFYERFGKAEELQQKTGTPAFKAMINTAKYIFFAQEQFSEEFKNVTAIVPYSQYWGQCFTGKTKVEFTESTNMGNHNYFWDQINNTHSPVAEGLGITHLLSGKLCKPLLPLNAPA